MRLTELRNELSASESAHDNTVALPERIKYFVESFDELERPKAKAIFQTILNSAHIGRGGKIELEFR